MKNIKKLALIALLLIAVSVTFVACGGSVTSIEIDTNNMPQTTFVQGNELDLSKGKLIVNRGDKSETISLVSDGVEVSGYDKNALGRQELTITYKEQSTTLAVTTVQRIASDGLMLNYFVGEQLNLDEGRVRITNDDGTSFVAKLTDPEITVSGFTTQSVGEVAFTVKYSKGAVSYQSTLTANVYAISSYEFQRPSKLNYYSHEQLDLSGGRISYRNSNGSLTRTIPLDESMISGFDLSVAGPSNRDLANGVKQTITVKYGSDFTRTYEISIIFSDVSLVKLRAKELEGINWNTDPVITDEQGQAAIEAVNAYAGLSFRDRNYVDNSERQIVTRVAAVYGLRQWKSAFDEYSDVFIEEDGAYSIKGDISYDTVAATISKLSDKNQAIYVYSNALAAIASDEDLAEVTMFDGDDVTATQYLANVMSGKDFDDTILSILKYMVSIYDGLSTVPSNWRSLDLNDYRLAITNTYNTIYLEGIANRSIHAIVNSWRDDFFDILYTYFLGLGESGLNPLDTLATFVYLPGQLEQLHTYMYIALSEHISLNLLGDKYDTTNFMMYFAEAQRLKQSIEKGSNELYKTILSQVGFTDIFSGIACTADLLMDFMLRSTYYASTAAFQDYFQYGQIGYYSINGAMQDVGAYDEMWSSYLALVKEIGSVDADDDTAADKLSHGIESLLEKFVALSPAQQLGFIQSVNAFYSDSRLEFDFSRNARTIFTYLINLYYDLVLPEASRNVFNDLMMALESYARRDVFESYGFDNFRELVAKADVAYQALQGEDKASFDSHALFLYNKCMDIYAMYNQEGKFVGNESALSSESAALLESLKEAFRNLNTVASLIYNNDDPVSCFAALYANYEVVNDIVGQILASGDSDLINLYHYGEIKLFDSDDAATYNPEFLAMLNYRGIFYELIVMHQVLFDGNNVFLYDVYNETGLPDFLKDAAYVIMQYINYLFSQQSPSADEIDMDRVRDVLDKYQSLSLSEQALLLSIDRNLNPSTNIYTSSYHLGLLICYSVELDGEFTVDNGKMGNDLVYKLLYVTEIDYIRYNYRVDRNETPVTKGKLLQDIEALKSAYESLSQEEQAAFDQLLGDVYSKYVTAEIE